MTHRAFPRTVSAAAVLCGVWLASGCGGDDTPDTDPDDPRSCSIDNHNSVWTDFNFTGDITEPDTCPVRLDSMPQLLEFSGFIAAPLALINSPSGFIKVENNDDQTVSQQEGDVGRIFLNYFKDQNADEWQATFDETYLAATSATTDSTGRDTAIFKTTFQATDVAPTDDSLKN